MRTDRDYYIPEPTIILLGCQAWPPKPEEHGCPICGPGVRDGHNSTYCAVCDSVSPQREAQIRAARLGMKARDRMEAMEQNARAELRKPRRTELSEAEKRRLWNGYKGGILSPTAEVTNRSKVGREWLNSIGQAPDWSLILDKQGHVLGRYEDHDSPAA